MVEFALEHEGPASIRYPKTPAIGLRQEGVVAERTPIVLGKAEVVASGSDGAILCCGTLLSEACNARSELMERGLDVGVVNARFVKPLDRELIEKLARESGFLVTVEEGSLEGGFGSAVLECLNDVGLGGTQLLRLGVPDRFIEHGDREELLADLGLDRAGIVKACLQLAEQCGIARTKLAEQTS